jgi:acyl-CoA synthetase (AMP-forming)/AMP-acid ligase II/thioesterase domain-containing protein/acyl carrier protein
LVDISRWRAEKQGNDLAFTHLIDGESEEVHLSYGELDRRARAVAAELQRRGLAGHRILLVINPGIEYVVAVFGCFYARAVAVPVYPPDPSRAEQTLPRLHAVVQDAEASLVLTSENVMHGTRGPLHQAYGVRTLQVESIPEALAPEWSPDFGDSSELALLQYTSGTTDTPKGVMLTHGNLMHNFRALHRLDTAEVVGVCWLPPYHDMGLVGGVLLPVYSGRRNVLMSPVAFIQRPARWLHAISRYRGTTSGSPDFGYALCVRKMGPEDCKGLDLDCWVVAVSGAEPVRAETMDRFTEKFAPYGFRRETFYPAYGLAETTVLASGGRRVDPPVVRRFSRRLLEENRVAKPRPSDPSARALVGSGRPVPGAEVAIVDPKSGRRLGPGRVGEIWFRGPSVGVGYWNQPEATQRVFHACPDGENNVYYLRTGDLGFIDKDELFVTGRLKELIILRGRNYYPGDIEPTIHRCHPALKSSGAAFTVDVDGEEQLVVVQEARLTKKYDAREVVRCIRQELAAQYELTPYCVILVAAGTLPKTSSGKMRRRASREGFLRGELRALFQWYARQEDAERKARSAPADPPQTTVERTVARLFGEVLGSRDVGRHDDFFSLGGRSVHTAQIMASISAEFGVDLPLRQFFQQPTVAALAAAINQGRCQREEAGGTTAIASSHGATRSSSAPRREDRRERWRATRGCEDVPPFLAPRNSLESDLAELWQEILCVHPVGIRDGFLELGGDSETAHQVAVIILEQYEVDLTGSSVQEARTIEQLATRIRQRSIAASGSPVVPIQAKGGRRPLFTVHPAGGYLFLYYRLAEYLGADQPIYGLQARGLEEGELPHASVQHMATDYVAAVRQVQPVGPFALGGWSFGGLVAYEMARQLVDQGQSVGVVTLIDPPPVARGTSVSEQQLLAMLNDFIPEPYRPLLTELRQLPLAERRRCFVEQVEIQKLVPPSIKTAQARRMYEVFEAISQAVLDYQPEPFSGKVHVLQARQQLSALGPQPPHGWNSLALGGVQYDTVPGDHLTMFHEPHIQVLAEKLRNCLLMVG